MTIIELVLINPNKDETRSHQILKSVPAGEIVLINTHTKPNLPNKCTK
jgi:hypothetical protein